jgi:DNA-binding transcriptional regulator YhcF (GntR family)
MDHERFALNPDSGLPLYLQIAHEFIYRIETGMLQPGNKLPGIRKLAKELKVSFLTVDKSYRWLRARGVVSTRRGVGVKVALSLDPSGDQTRLRMQINKFVDKMMAQAISQHFDPMTVAQTVLHRATAMQRRMTQRRVIFVECLPEYVDDYIAELQRGLSDTKVHIDGLLTTDLAKMMKARNSQAQTLLDSDYVMTTLYHYDFVHRAVAPLKLRVIALSHTLDAAAIRKIVGLPPKCRLAALLGPSDPAAAIIQTLEYYRDLPSGSVPFAIVSDVNAVRKLIVKADVILYTGGCRPYINALKKNNKLKMILMRFVPDQEAVNKVEMLLGSQDKNNRLLLDPALRHVLNNWNLDK